jgi:hypothetical protein
VQALLDHLMAGLRAFRSEWAKARRYMLDDKQRNIERWRNTKG